MQLQHLKLKEIIWEITGKCNNNCSYCGSKHMKSSEVSQNIILKIAEQIALYPPEEINISGGDPFLVDINTHEEIIKIFKEKDIKCKILINPKSLNGSTTESYILKMYDWFGLSINTIEESTRAEKYLYNIPGYFTVITNFNVLNLYEFEKIEEFVIKNNRLWTIQFTVYNDVDNKLAVYNNDSAFNYLQDKINNSKANIILSDNLNECNCSAGINSIGITYNGDVIPCLFMRSWERDENIIQGNIIDDSLEEIWKYNFINNRFREFKCCKDICKNKVVKMNNNIKLNINKQQEFLLPDLKLNQPQNIIMYGVVDKNNMAMMYGVVDNWNNNSFGNIINKTTDKIE